MEKDTRKKEEREGAAMEKDTKGKEAGGGNIMGKEDIEFEKLMASSFANLQRLIDNCPDTKSGKSIKCAYEKDLSILYLIGGKLSYEEEKKLIRRLGRLDKVDWIEIDKETYLKEEGYLYDNYKVSNGKYFKK